MLKQENVIYRNTFHGGFYFYDARTSLYYGFIHAEHAKRAMMRGSWIPAGFNDSIEPYLDPLSFAEQAAIIREGV